MAATIKTELEFKDKGVEAGFRAVAAEVRQYRESIETKLGPSQEALVRRSREQTAAMKDATKATKGSGMGLMQFAQFADDAQYGMKGILNNVPGVVMGMGMSMGVAGAVSLATLVLYKFGPALMEVTGLIDGAGIASGKMASSFNKTLREIQAKQQALESERAEMKKYVAELEVMRTTVQEFARVDAAAGEAGIQRMKERLAAEQELARAKGNVQSSSTTNPIEKSKIAAQLDEQGNELTIEGLREEMAMRENLRREMAQQAGELYKQQDVVHKAQAEQNNLLIDAEKIQKRLDAARRNAATARAQEKAAEGTRGTGAMRESLGKFASTEESNAEQLERELQALRDKAEQMGQLAKEAKQQFNDAEKANTEAMKAEGDKIRSLQEQIQRKEQLAELARVAAQNELEAARNAERIAQAEKAATEEKKRQAEAVDAARKAVTAAQAEQEYAMVTKIAELRKAGNKDAADALQKEMNIRRDAASLESQGVERARAMAMARARATAQEAQAAGVPGGGSRRFLPERIGGLRDTTPFGGGGRERFLPVRIGGLRTEAQRTEQAANRAAAARTNPHEDAAMKYYESSLQKQAELVEIFKNLGAI